MVLRYGFGIKKMIELPQSLHESHALILSQQEAIMQLQARYRQMLELQFDEAESVPTEELPKEEDNTITVTYTRSKPKRRPLPDNLPREVIEHDVPEHEKQCACGCLKQRIGEEVTEQLKVIPAQLKVIQHVRPKYACNRCDEGVTIAPMPKLFLPNSMATPSLVAYTIISKYQDHLPLYRQEKM